MLDMKCLEITNLDVKKQGIPLGGTKMYKNIQTLFNKRGSHLKLLDKNRDETVVIGTHIN